MSALVTDQINTLWRVNLQSDVAAAIATGLDGVTGVTLESGGQTALITLGNGSTTDGVYRVTLGSGQVNLVAQDLSLAVSPGALVLEPGGTTALFTAGIVASPSSASGLFRANLTTGNVALVAELPWGFGARFSPGIALEGNGTTALVATGDRGLLRVVVAEVPPPPPVLSVAPPSIDFGPVTVGGSSTKDFTVQNTGGGTLTGTAITSAPFSVASGGTFSLGAGQSQAVTVRFSPTSATMFVSNVTITSNGGDASPGVQGQGVAPPPPPKSDLVIESLTVSPTSGLAGSQTTVSFTIRNQGAGTANASTTNIRLATSSTNVTTSDPLLASMSTPAIAAGGTSLVSQAVTIPAATAAGSYFLWVIADVENTANQSDVTNDRANTPFTCGAPPALSVSPPSLDFQSVPVGTTLDKDFTIQNAGGGTLTGTASASVPFSIVAGSSFSLGAGQSQAVTVRFSPTSATAFVANLTITSNGGSASPGVQGKGATSPPPVDAKELIAALKGFRKAIIDKIDSDIATTVRAFGDAKDIQRPVSWFDLANAIYLIVVDTIKAVFDLLTLFGTDLAELNAKLSEGINESVGFAKTVSWIHAVEGLWQAGENLQVSIDGPTYSAAVKAMVETAEHAACKLPLCIRFDKSKYEKAIARILEGDKGPVVTPHRTSDTDRRKFEVRNGVSQVKQEILSVLNGLITQLSQSGTVPGDFPLSSVMNEVGALTLAARQSKSANVDIAYVASLQDGEREIEHAQRVVLGRIAAMEQAEILALTQFNVFGFIQQLITVETAVDAALKAGGVKVGLTFHVLGEPGAAIAINMESLFTTGLTLLLKNEQTESVSARDLLNQIPAEMLASLPGELSDLWMMADDIVGVVRSKLR